MKDAKSGRLKKLPPYLFAEIDRLKARLAEQGEKVISLGVGDPDIPTPRPIIEVMKKAIEKAEYHQYPFGRGLRKFRLAVAEWYLRRFSVSLDPDKEILPLIGSKEGIGHLPLGLVNPGETVLVPEPGYPVYRGGTLLADAEPRLVPLLEKNGFLPELDEIPSEVYEKTRILFLNYPNNPTSALADPGLYEKAVALAGRHGFFVASDLAYSEIYFGEPPGSFLSLPGAREVGIEFHSLSKTFNMTGWRIGWAAGNEELIAGLSQVKDNYDSGVFSAIQEAGAFALLEGGELAEENRRIWKERRDFFYPEILRLGFRAREPRATFYIWAALPGKISSAEGARKILEEAKVIVTPGSGFGPSGEGYVRFAFTADRKTLEEALARLKKIRW